MNLIREQIIKNGVVPIISIEGSKCLFEEYLKSIIEKKYMTLEKLNYWNIKKLMTLMSIHLKD